ncbi:MAG: hypothetical protein WCT40_01820 [Candidatus Magasanikbacteria bacterium]
MSLAKKLFKIFQLNSRGNILLLAIVFGFIGFSVVVGAVTSYAIAENRASVHKHNREMAFQIAEAGINYYRWHLAHAKDDFQDGTGAAGPYIHAYTDKDGNAIGHFELEVGAPSPGSTVVEVTSTGWLDSQPDSRRKMKVRLGFPSLVDYAFLTNTDVWIGDTEATHGKFHANGGIRFDGTADAPVVSAMATYTCKSYHGCGNQTKPGIWGDGTPDDYWQFPVPAKDFEAVTQKLAEVKTGADPDNGGIYLTSSGEQGYRLSFQSNGAINIYKVTATNCYNGQDVNSNKYESFCIDIKTTGSAVTYTMPTSGMIYVEDNVWVDGVVNGRVVIGTSAGKDVIVNGNILYAAKDGRHALGLIAENNILIPHDSPDYLEIDAALLAQNGACKRYYYAGNKKTSLTIYGAIITNKIWTWSWVSGGGSVVSGYLHTDSTYDANLTYGPPPGFPVGSEYNLISWELID